MVHHHQPAPQACGSNLSQVHGRGDADEATPDSADDAKKIELIDGLRQRCAYGADPEQEIRGDQCPLAAQQVTEPHSRYRSGNTTNDGAGRGKSQSRSAEAKFLFEEYDRPRDHHQVIAEQEAAQGRHKRNEYDVENSIVLSQTEDAGGRPAHDSGQVPRTQEPAVFLDPVPGLPVGAEAVLEGHVGAPEQLAGTDVFHHRLQGGPHFPVGVVEEIAEPHRKAHLQIAFRIPEGLPDVLWQADPVPVQKHPPRKAVGETADRVRVAFHPAHQDPQFVEIPAASVLQGHGARSRAQGEEDRNLPGGGRLPEWTIGAVVPGGAAAQVAQRGNELDGVKAELIDGRVQFPDDGVGLRWNPPFVHRGHGAQAVRIPAHAVRQIAAVADQHGVGVQERHVHAGIVHLGDEAVGSELQVSQVGRVKLLGVVLSVDGPDHPAALAIHSKVHVGQIGQILESRRRQGLGRGRRPVPNSPGGLMVSRVSRLNPGQMLLGTGVPRRLVPGRKHVGVRVYDHGPSLSRRAVATGGAGPGLLDRRIGGVTETGSGQQTCRQTGRPLDEIPSPGRCLHLHAGLWIISNFKAIAA